MPKRGVVRNLTRPNELRTSLAASGVVGTWEWDLLNHCVYYDEEAAALHTGDPSLAGQPIRVPISIANVHPEDREWMVRDMAKAVQTGGLFLVEYRIMNPDRSVRWLLCRGRIYRGEDGRAVRCRGIMIDITESRDAGDTGEGYVAQPSSHEESLIVQAADRCLETRAVLEQLGSQHLLQKADELLLAVGRELAREVHEQQMSHLH
ncbi:MULTISPECIES: PAS domain-containing protein [unclassified Methylobacterium]|uniref:PAS domain-containing protein n=1 Tax=unclassified Methylobacterium TaxID=2615210 RepID=UPI0011C1ED9B|nr:MULTISPECIES: PAS domain-containing protein [unclassified Methylobacterium]QEE41334.1 diguanylate cyclase [Methylobacterium sp. WL1]TXN57764.1 PAS domain-containing protein [Methylobacterium sp. WL2]